MAIRCNAMCLSGLLFFFYAFIYANGHNTSALVPAIIIFGDSAVDVGNNNYLPTISGPTSLPMARTSTILQLEDSVMARLPLISQASNLEVFFSFFLALVTNLGIAICSWNSGRENISSSFPKPLRLWQEPSYRGQFCFIWFWVF